MIARYCGERGLPEVEWTSAAELSWRQLGRFIQASAGGNVEARRQEIDAAIDRLRYAPLRGTRITVRHGWEFRRINVRRFVVYYVLIPGRGLSGPGRLSVRAIRHGAMERPFLGVRDSPAYGAAP